MVCSLKIYEEIEKFIARHNLTRRPIVLVTSGGTTCSLEVNSVRSLDNFSTGYRGAFSVEEFLNHGYAVIHLWREGSASPYGHILSDFCGCRLANHGLGIDSLTSLFEHGDNITLRKCFLKSSELQKARREHSRTVLSQLILTVPFQTVEEYLIKLDICAQQIKKCGVLGMIYLAAAVSDYYIPMEEKSLHKLNINERFLSTENTNVENLNILTIGLRPVMKCVSKLRNIWAPNAFCVTFKLETDRNIVAKRCFTSMIKNDIHIVVGNILNKRYEWVFILENNFNIRDISCDYMKNITGRKIKLIGVPRNFIEIKSNNPSIINTLEQSMISCLVEKHQNYIDKYIEPTNYIISYQS